jgi:hypothetical protein
MSAIYFRQGLFSVGFIATNFGFSGSSAAFVETVKAAEPITCAALCVLWRIETISPLDFWSLACIVAGFVLSTVGNQETTSGNAATLAASFASCVIVMASNLFSFRRLYQKCFGPNIFQCQSWTI